MHNHDNRQLFLEHIAQTSDGPLGLEVESAKGSWLHLKDGTKILDFISGIAVSSLGHGHPRVIRAIKEQVDRHLHVMVYGEMVIESQVLFSQLLCDNLPDRLQSIYLTNSGTEAIEGALKLAKKFTGRTKMVSFRQSYHGDTHGSLSVTGREVYKESFKPLLPDVHFADFNGQDCFDLIDGKTACVILEPIQGEGGIIPAQQKWMEQLVSIAKTRGALTIFDEIQSGFGRTGKLFAFEHYEIVPDILCIAKAAGAGMPLGGFVSSKDILKSFQNDPPLSHVTTFGGHPVSCAAAYEGLRVLLEESLIKRADWIEDEIRTKMKHESIVEIRGKGAMLGLQLNSADTTRQFVETCRDNGLLLGWTLHSDSLVRLAPPLTITQEHLDLGIQTMLTSL